MVSSLAALALLGGLPNIGDLLHKNPDARVERSRVQGWRLVVVRDAFSGQTRCKLDKPAVAYRHGVVTFQLGHGVNTAGAEFRVDDGELRAAASFAVEAAGLGARLSGSNLRNPSDGAVNIPASALNGARSVLIRADNDAPHRSFSLAGLSQALQTAREKNCDVV